MYGAYIRELKPSYVNFRGDFGCFWCVRTAMLRLKPRYKLLVYHGYTSKPEIYRFFYLFWAIPDPYLHPGMTALHAKNIYQKARKIFFFRVWPASTL